jgi:hypothetical protein
MRDWHWASVCRIEPRDGSEFGKIHAAMEDEPRLKPATVSSGVDGGYSERT